MIYISGIWINAHRKNGLTTDHRLKVLANYIYFDEKILIWSVLSTTICWREGLRIFYLSCNFVLKDVLKWASKTINSYDIYIFLYLWRYIEDIFPLKYNVYFFKLKIFTFSEPYHTSQKNLIYAHKTDNTQWKQTYTRCWHFFYEIITLVCIHRHRSSL